VNHLMKAETAKINFSPVGFQLMAEDFLCYYDGFKPQKFSIVSYFLCGRAIELALKARHLQVQVQGQVKGQFGHDLEKSYSALPACEQLLTPSEVELLKKVNDVYKSKYFEYVDPRDAATGFSRFPSIDELAILARKIVTQARKVLSN